MKTSATLAFAASCVAMLLPSTGLAISLLDANDFIIAIDTDPGTMSNSNSPGGEGAVNALDLNPGTKYLNFGQLNTGFIATPFTPSTTVQSLRITTANDEPNRDPLTYELYGTNDTVTSGNDSFGDQENWSLISSGVTGLDTDPNRFSAGPVQSFANATAYNSYRVVFPTVRDAANSDSMQIGDFELFTSNDGTGSTVFNIANPVVAIGLDTQPSSSSPGGQTAEIAIDAFGGSQSGSPGGEGPENVVDGTLAKYLNFGGTNSGFIVTPSFGSAQVQSFQLTTANDAEGRDPAKWQLFGTNDPITSGNNSFGTSENWTLVDFGDVNMPAGRDTPGPVIPVTNATSYSSYKMLFPELKIINDPLMQIAEAAFFLDPNGSGLNILSPGDPVLAVDPDAQPGTQTTYLNFGKENSGFIVTPSAGSTILDEFQITTGGDEPPRDPASWEIYGTNDPITSESNSQGDQENWVLIDSGTFDPNNAEIPLARHTTGALVSVNNSTAYSSYRMIFPTLRDSGAANSMQFAQVDFFGTATDNADFDGNGIVDGLDFLIFQTGFGLAGQTDNSNGDANGDGVIDSADLAVWETQYGSAPITAAVSSVPEPSAAVLTLVGLLGAFASSRRRVSRG